jgi:hypothetical protein
MAACIPVRMRLWESQMLSSTMCDVYCLRRQDRSEKSRTISLHFHLFLRLIIYIYIYIKIYTYTQYIWHPCECPGSIVGKQCADQIEHLAKLSHDTGHHTAAEANLLRHLLGVTKSDSLVDVSCQLVDLAVELCNA